jgi:peptidoglycan/LPS O-acetylase OafA/YrhL
MKSETIGWTSVGRGMVGFLIGAVIPAPSGRAGIVATAAAVAFVLLRCLATWANWNATLPVVMFPFLIWGLVGCGRTWLDSKLMVWLGDLSYSVYLWQGPMALITYYQIRPRLMDMPLVVKLCWAVLEMVILLSLAAWSYRKVELPARQWVRAWLGS